MKLPIAFPTFLRAAHRPAFSRPTSEGRGKGLPFPLALRASLLLVSFAGGWCLSLRAGPRLDQIQVIGTHNSYHIAPHPSVQTLLRDQIGDQIDSLDYTHRPLADQLERLGIRQIELDLYADPDGGLFADPAAVHLVAERGMLPVPPPPPDIMKQPGAKILHVPDFDFQTTVPTLRHALTELSRWSSQHEAHIPIFVLLELKSEAAGPDYAQPLPWTLPRLDALEAGILEVLPRARLLTPDDVRRGQASLRTAVQGHGWPSLASARGRFVFLLDNTDGVRDLYLSRSATLEGRLFFVSVAEKDPAAAWFKINDPVAEADRIRTLVRQGFLVRTRADADTAEARHVDVRRRDTAFASGAQLISTDYPEPRSSWGGYVVRWPDGHVARPNPVSAAGWRADWDLEDLAIAGVEPFDLPERALLDARAIAFHTPWRRLGEASADYARLLELDPPSRPSKAQEDRMLRLAPLLETLPEEPFPLRDVVAIHHPTRALIAYHLFWADDIDFPEDNDPTDHEVLWVSYEPISGRPLEISTYFHGTILRGAAHGDHPRVAVEWGKHGTLPVGARGEVNEPERLRGHWQTLHTQGIRRPDHPLARDWPKRFTGSWEDYLRFSRLVDSRSGLEKRRLLWVGAWGNAILDQYALPYNFAPKTEWPD